MLVSGEIENVPLLDVVQVVAYSKQTGVLRVKGPEASGSLVFVGGALLCGESTATKPLLARAASEADPRAHLALRRAGTLAVLTELLGLRSGSFRFEGMKTPLAELAGVSLGPLYAAGPLDTGELLLVLATAIDKPVGARADTSGPAPEQARSHPRFAPTVLPASLTLDGSVLDGHLTNVSEGGGFFHGAALPPAESVCEMRFTLPGDGGRIDCRVRVAWTRADAKTGRAGAGLAFVQMSHEGRGRLSAYLARYQRLADEYQEPKREPVSR
jgi:hypothetical protein